MQFVAGVLLAVFVKRDAKTQFVKSIVFVICMFLLIFEVTYLTKIGYAVNTYVTYGYFTFLLFCLMNLSLVNLEISFGKTMDIGIKLPEKISKYTYIVFMA